MKSLQSILLWVLLAAVAVLYVLHFSGGKKATETKANIVVKDSAGNELPQHIKVAYIDLDTVQKYYEFFKLKNEELEREKNRYDNQIQSDLNKLERDRVEFLKKGQAITQVEAEKFQQEYQTRYQQIGQRQQTYQGQHLENQSRAIDEIQKKINEYLKEYNKTGKYNFIFSTQEGNPTLYYKDTAFNITTDVVKGLNDAYKQSKKQ
ncbi:periplasmic chaperone for outer membrane proteins Skp [Lacibacter cauensis]|uniref:Periplasmic chaperone for outer membrane proteins Skp n=1 Tax=Lacibacter cauensis TaxID=510947 RepID=A0A562SCJ0_9BACT|nr:OmpH family outer membrane protein [Lacibacter cauensis]TWI79067.1 periplasmic chaperone for outer membrane proteins Skp [Lacibacter cauensis]